MTSIGSQEDFLEQLSPAAAAMIVGAMKASVEDVREFAGKHQITAASEHALWTNTINPSLDAIQENPALEGFEKVTVLGQIFWRIGHYWVRVKTLSQDFKTRNARTDQQEQISFQGPLEGLDQGVYATMGPRYLALTGEVIDYVCVKHLAGPMSEQAVEWWISLVDHAAGVVRPSVHMLPLPGPSTSVVTPAAVRPRAPRRADEDAADKNVE